MVNSSPPLPFDAVIRVSRRNGRSGEAFMSPRDQREAIGAMAARHGVAIARWWDETDSVSGKTTDREGLQAALKRALEGETAGILVAKIDRFARTVTGGLGAIGRLEAAGRQLWSAREGVIVGPEPADAMAKLIRTIWLGLAQWQLDTLTEGWEATRQNHISAGIPNHAKFGYRKDPVTRRLVPDPETSRWVVPIFERRADRQPWAGIADWLRDQGVPGDWGVSSVKQIVESRIYLGEIRSGDVVNERAHEPLVAFELWNRANSVVTTKGKRRAAEPYLLTSIIRCASCGVRMFGVTDRRTNAAGGVVAHRYYRCRGRHGAWGRCEAPARVLADDVEALVDARFREAFLGDRLVVPTEATGEVEAAEKAVAEAEAELDAFVTNAAALEAELFTRGLSARQARRDEAREALAEARSAALGVALPVGLGEVWETLTVEERRPFIADAFALVAVARGPEPTAERVRAWLAGDPSTPRSLPGTEGCSTLTPISW